MARPNSIPSELHGPIVKRWAMGESAEAIVRWIEQTNWRRAKPVKTSRWSVERLLERTELQDARRSSFAVMSRLRRQAPVFLERLDALDGEYARLAEQADLEIRTDPDHMRETQARFSIRLRALARREFLAARRVRMAGLSGAGLRRLEADHGQELGALEAEVADQTTADLMAEIYLDDLDAAMEQLAPPPAPVAPEAAPEAPAEVANDVRNEEGSPAETSPIESHTEVPAPEFRPLKAGLPVPLVRTPAWPLTPAQEAEWRRIQEAANTWLMIAYRQNAPDPAPREVPPTLAAAPPEDLGSRIVPVIAAPNWPVAAPYREALQAEVNRANGWLCWLREKITRDVAPARAAQGQRCEVSDWHPRRAS